MRMGFGLVSLLVVVGIAMLIFKNVEAPTLEKGREAQKEAQQISGRDENGMPAMNSYKAEEYRLGPAFTGVKVTDVTPGGPMDKFYGLKVGDVVLAINGLQVTAVGDYGSAKGQLDQAFQENKPLLVDRGGVKMTLPQGASPTAGGSPINIPMH